MQCLPEFVLAVSSGDAKKKKETKLGLAHSKQTSFGDWYSEVVVESEMISYYDVSGTPSVVLFGNMSLAYLK
jgi:thioredoxin-related protein